MWTEKAWPRVLRLAAKRSKAGEAFDILALGTASVVTGSAGAEHWMACGHGNALRMDVAPGTLLKGPVQLWLNLRGPREIHSAIGALRQLADLWRGRKLGGAETLSRSRATRLIRLLRVLDALAAGASQRAIAAVMFDPSVADPRWRLERASVRLQVQRAVRNARAMSDGGYRGLLRDGD